MGKTIDELLPEFIEFAEDIFKNPEIGFHEFQTREKVIRKLEKYGIPYETVAYTGIKAVLDSGRAGPNIGLVAEFDGIPVLGHPYANPDPEQLSVAHACGHYAQIGNFLAVFIALKEQELMKDLCGKVTLLVTPAEEFCNMDYRRQLIEEGKIHYPSGKQEMLAAGVFDDIDIVLNIHSQNNGFESEVNCSATGFMHKEITFFGKASHAGANPEGGINALNAATLAMTGVNFLRETFRASDAIRVHYYMPEGGQTVNSIPSRTKIEMYIRAGKTRTIFEVNDKVDHCMKAGAYAIGCEVEIKDTAGYFPFNQDKNLSDFMLNHIRKYVPDEKIQKDQAGFASSDVGDLSMFIPTIQTGMAGFEGTFHGTTFRTSDTHLAYDIPVHTYVDAVVDLLKDHGAEAYRIRNAFTPVMTKEEYIQSLDRLNETRYYDFKNGLGE